MYIISLLGTNEPTDCYWSMDLRGAGLPCWEPLVQFIVSSVSNMFFLSSSHVDTV